MLNWLIFGISIQDILNYILLFGIIVLLVFLFIKYPISRWFICGAFVLLFAVSGVFSGYKLNEYYSASGGIFGKIEELINPNKVNISTTTTNVTFDFSQVILSAENDTLYAAKFSSKNTLSLNSNENYKVCVNGEPSKIIDYSNSSLVAKYNYSFYGIDGTQILTDELTFTFGFNKYSTDLVVSTTGSAEAVALWNSYFDKNQFKVNISTTSDTYVSESNTANLIFMHEDTILEKVIIPVGSEFTLPDSMDVVGYRFMGYSLDGASILEDTTFTVNFSQIVYVILEEIDYIRFNELYSGFDNANDNIIEIVGYIDGENIGEFAPENPTRDNYTFLGWSLDGETIVDLSTLTNDGTISNIYAVWEPCAIDISFVLDSGSTIVNDVTYSENFVLTYDFDEQIILSEPIKEHYSFYCYSVELVDDSSTYYSVSSPTFGLSLNEIVEDINSQYDIRDDEDFTALQVKDLTAVNITIIYLANTDDVSVLSDSDIRFYLLNNSYTQSEATDNEEFIRQTYENIVGTSSSALSLYEVETNLLSVYGIETQIDESITTREYLEILYNYAYSAEL